MDFMDKKIIDFIKSIDLRLKVVFISVFGFGFLSHGCGFFNKFAMHDEVGNLFGVGATYTSGRWFLYILDKIICFLFGTTHFSTPLFHVFFSLLLLSCSLCIIIRLYDLRRVVGIVLLSFVFVSYPLFTALFSLYMFTAPYYVFGLLMATYGVYLICRKKTVSQYLVAMLILTCSLGIYQAYIPYIISLILIYFISEIINQTKLSFRWLLQKGFFYIVNIVCFVGLYFLITFVFLKYQNATLTHYAGINQMGNISLEDLKNGLLASYSFLFSPIKTNTILSYNLYYGNSYFFSYLIYGMTLLISLYLIWIKPFPLFKKICLVLSGILLFPCINGIFIISPNHIHILMCYGQLALFVGIFSFWDKLSYQKICIFLYIFIFCLSLINCRYANIAYLKNEYTQQRLISYYTTLISHIKSTNGYKSNYPVIYINENKIQDITAQEIPEFTLIPILTDFGAKPLLNDYAWRSFMYIWCGFNPKTGWKLSQSEIETIQKMPSYPDEGSIRVINEKVIVKF